MAYGNIGRPAWLLAIVSLIGLGAILVDGSRILKATLAGIASPATPTALPEAELVPVSQTVDVGEVQVNTIVHATFNLVNRGSSPVAISDVIPSCGCTTATLSHQPVPPGGSLSIVATVSTTGFHAGKFLKSIACKFAPPYEDKALVLYLLGTIDASGTFSVFPGVVNFGKIHRGDTMERIVYIRAPQALLDELPPAIHLLASDATITLPAPGIPLGDIGIKPVRLVLSIDAAVKHGQTSGHLDIVVENPVRESITVQHLAYVLAKME